VCIPTLPCGCTRCPCRACTLSERRAELERRWWQARPPSSNQQTDFFFFFLYEKFLFSSSRNASDVGA
jgi:hypothetical protein